MNKTKISIPQNTLRTGYVYILTNPSFREDWVKIGRRSRPVNIRSKELDNTAVPLPFEIFAVLQSSKYIEVEHLIHQMIDELTDLRIRPNREFFNVDPVKALNIFCNIAFTIDDAVVTIFKNNQPLKREESDRLLHRLIGASCKTASRNSRKYNTKTNAEARDNSQPKSLSEERTPITQTVHEGLINNPSLQSPDITSQDSKRRKPKASFQFDMVGIKKGDTLTFIPTQTEVNVLTNKTIEYQGKEYTLTGFTKEFLPAEKRTRSGAYQGPNFFTFKGRNLVKLRNELENEKNK